MALEVFPKNNDPTAPKLQKRQVDKLGGPFIPALRSKIAGIEWGNLFSACVPEGRPKAVCCLGD